MNEISGISISIVFKTSGLPPNDNLWFDKRWHANVEVLKLQIQTFNFHSNGSTVVGVCGVAKQCNSFVLLTLLINITIPGRVET